MLASIDFKRFDALAIASREMVSVKESKYIHVRDRSLNFGKTKYGTPPDEARKEGLYRLKIFTNIMIKHGQHVEGLSFSKTKLGANGAKYIVKILKQCPNLKVLELTSCRLGSRHDWEKPEGQPCGFKIMMSAIAHHPNIKQIKGIDKSNWFNPEEKMEVRQFFRV